MSSAPTTSRRFVPGTTGWTVDDLDDQRIGRLWEAGHYEIVEGVLTRMPPAYFEGGLALGRLVRVVERHLREAGRSGEFAYEVELVVRGARVARVDAAFVTPADLARQAEANARAGRRKLRYGRFVVPPTLVIESVSPGHELHDRQTKRGWFAGMGVPHYWLLDAYQRTLECLALRGTDYVVDAVGGGTEVVKPSLFAGLVVSLGELWVT